MHDQGSDDDLLPLDGGWGNERSPAERWDEQGWKERCAIIAAAEAFRKTHPWSGHTHRFGERSDGWAENHPEKMSCFCGATRPKTPDERYIATLQEQARKNRVARDRQKKQQSEAQARGDDGQLDGWSR